MQFVKWGMVKTKTVFKPRFAVKMLYPGIQVFACNSIVIGYERLCSGLIEINRSLQLILYIASHSGVDR